MDVGLSTSNQQSQAHNTLPFYHDQSVRASVVPECLP